MPRMLSIPAADGGSFQAYLAEPASRKGPGVLVIQEIFGINTVMRGICDDLARQGYFALCPDLFWRIEPGIMLDDRIEPDLQRAFQLFGQFDIDKGITDLKAALAVLRKLDGATGKAGSVGYCLGGRLAYLMATRSDVDASVGFYGVYLQNHLDEAATIKKPLLLHCATEDKFVPKEAQAQIAAGLKGHALVTREDYVGQDHAFARIGGEHYNKEAADLANGRTRDFFKKHLG
ncbi:dienelactone hydrolase family protein [Ferrovibrio sp.]|uniref:dienelactone hydrolase family protein n=1 Tax=Ferrovibrio sp. TaxID=1917215 RepID=UPI0025B96112|nr:dienelactone hydrolase family protein [Ferrovibrio sp.]MBX3454516.1 dienelactone hydrolase family protein [Ferrovibrio sp.]